MERQCFRCGECTKSHTWRWHRCFCFLCEEADEMEAKTLTEYPAYEVLKRWIDERRLQLLPSNEEIIDRAVKEILRRVSMIDRCCAEEYAENINKVWRKLCNKYSFRERLVMKNGRHKNEPNWYFIANIIDTMARRGVYGNETCRSLTIIMHGKDKKNIANNARQVSYQMSEVETNDLKNILTQFSKCIK